MIDLGVHSGGYLLESLFLCSKLGFLVQNPLILLKTSVKNVFFSGFLVTFRYILSCFTKIECHTRLRAVFKALNKRFYPW